MSSEVTLRDVPPEAFKAMLDFFYDGQLNEEIIDSGSLLLQLLLLADRFGVTFLHQECCKMLLECLSQVVGDEVSLLGEGLRMSTPSGGFFNPVMQTC
ncbi:BTB/POZ domain-containing protein [Trifolium medium]|uniref:BTB/POZ domain-containing protein n=1 Tax=Trifolium medium TaxID=97028 RepID=A0A392NUP3_9FABA|nr:BTB/POZ domain-containing protein [Trifolium medium]